MKGRRAYIDTNVLVYVAFKHPDFYESCKQVLKEVAAGGLEAYGSQLVLFELFGALARHSAEAAYEAVSAYLSLPVRLVSPTRRTFLVAREVSKVAGVSYDALHAALASEAGADVVVTEDLEDWKRIKSAWSEVAGKYRLDPLEVYSPTRGFL